MPFANLIKPFHSGWTSFTKSNELSSPSWKVFAYFPIKAVLVSLGDVRSKSVENSPLLVPRPKSIWIPVVKHEYVKNRLAVKYRNQWLSWLVLTSWLVTVDLDCSWIWMNVY